MDKHLHIVSLDVPFPPDYGGVADIFFRIKALYIEGVKIHLHCFDYGRGEQPELKKYCVEVIYYKRKTGLQGFSFTLPYIVKSRANKFLIKNLLRDDYPILLEGIHCTYFVYNGKLKNKKVFVRLHNVEFEYYKQLIKFETKFFKKIYFFIESWLLKKYEKAIAGKAMLLAITKKDENIYKNIFNAENIKHLPAFIPIDSVVSKTGTGSYCLYHGNLSISENEKAAVWLAENVFNDLDISFFVTGKNPSENIKQKIKKIKNVSLIANPSQEDLDDLISNAQINILPAFVSTGIKLKLLNALFIGRYCVVNNKAIDETGLEMFCHVAEKKDEFKTLIQKIFQQPFTNAEIEKRKNILEKDFNNKLNAQQLMQWIY